MKKPPLFVIGDQRHRILSMDWYGGELSNLMIVANDNMLFVRQENELQQNEMKFAGDKHILVGDIVSRIEWPEGAVQSDG